MWLVGGVANLIMGCAAVAALLNLVRFYRDAILAWAGAGVAAAEASHARTPSRRRPDDAGGAEQLLPPGAVDSAEVESPNPYPYPYP